MKRLFLLIVVVATTWTQTFSQNIQKDENSAVNQSIEKALESGVAFAAVDLIPAVNVFTEENKYVLDLGRSGLEYIGKTHPQYLEIDLPMTVNGQYELLLEENDLFADGFRMTDGYERVLGDEFELGQHYRGVIKGQPSSLVALSVFKDKISGFVKSQDEIWLIRNAVDASGQLESFMFQYDQQETGQLSCFTPDDDYVYSEDELTRNLSFRNSATVNIYVEVNDDIYNDKRQGTSSFVTGIFNESQTLYASDGISIQMSEMVIWTSKSPYKGNDASRLLNSFQRHHGSSGSWNGDLAHLISYKGSGGIAAGFNGLCNGDRRQSMCFSGIESSYAPVPTYSWTVMVFTHEMGHLMGSRHTHACVWNGNGTAIDGCYSTEGTCPRPGIPEDGGTIMSYCHLTAAGINFTKAFHDQPNNVILNSIAGASCLGGGTGGNHCTNGVQDADETGVDCGGADCPDCPTGSCDVPTNLYANNIRGNRARLNWDAMAGALSYDVQVREQGGSYTPQNTFNTSSNSLNLRGFSNGVTYEWRVRTNCNGSSSSYSSDCSFVAGDQNSGDCGTTLVRGSSEYAIYPNPAVSEITLVGHPQDGNTEISIFDLSGKRLITHSGISSNTIDVSGLQRGLFFMQIRTSDATQTLKFQLQ
ncbi:MAG: M12 family metallo-peptidase [Saprospiraceae bacterium]|nr:M12 family metallo-peptidase [Saprospiraceae bacterium]